MDSKKVAYYGVFASLAILMGYIEALVPAPVPVPGIKLGLANVIVLITLYYMGTKPAFFISLVRVFLSGLLFSGFAGLIYSLAGALLSFLGMALLKRCKAMSMLGISVVGGILHNIGQITVASLVVHNFYLFYYLPILLISGVITGVIIGIVAKYTLGFLKNRKF